jgi:hypothetical protein
MSETEDDGAVRRGRFWTSVPGVVTGATGLLTAVAGLLVALSQVGLLGGGDDSAAVVPPAVRVSTAPAAPSVAPTSSSAEPADGSALVGTWTGEVSGSDGAFDVTLTIRAPCELREVCGTMAVSSAPCEGEASLWRIKGSTYNLYVGAFTAASSPECSPGAGEYVELVDASHLRYSTGYSDATGVLTLS